MEINIEGDSKNNNIVTKGEWISVETELPKYDQKVLACDRPYVDIWFIDTYKYSNGKWWEWASPGNPADNVTHWMPLPNPPKE